MKKYIIITAVIFSFFACNKPSDKNIDRLYTQFSNPSDSARVFVRWWWNGNKLTKAEISRQLDLLKAAGVGGVEINPIAFPAASDPVDYKEIVWLSEEWLDMVEYTLKEAKERGLICDMIIGSGWPFGGEFLTTEQQTQLMTIGTTPVTGPALVKFAREDLIKNAEPSLYSKHNNTLESLEGLLLVPKNLVGLSDINEIPVAGNDSVSVEIPRGEYVLYSLVKLTGYMAVINGAKGANGPVMNHYDKATTEFFVGRMIKALQSRIGDLKQYIRALFVDSIELEGANWCNDMLKEFELRRGYSLEPYLPFVLTKIGEMGNAVEDANGAILSDSLKEQIKRVRYDFEVTKNELFRERFSQVVEDMCREAGVRSRMQAYGHGFWPVESSMSVDIPECETWHNLTIGKNMPEFGIPGAYFYNGGNTEFSRQGRAYTFANKFVSSGAHLAGKSIISCEELTNTEMLFNESMNQIKLIGDQSYLSGVTHSVLHGFNYSPADAPFPGWIQYGTYLNENNPFWPFFSKWTEYKARLSALFMNSEMNADIAILHPIADLWKENGAQRDPFPLIVHPEYGPALWEAIHQNGGGCDYLTEKIIREAEIKDQKLCFGTRKYKVLIMMDVESIEPNTVSVIEKFLEGGGKVIAIGATPGKSNGLKDSQINDKKVLAAAEKFRKEFPDRYIETDRPTKPLNLWYKEIASRYNLPQFMSFDKPNNFVSQISYRYGNSDIFFICNMNAANDYSVKVRFDLQGRQAWIWSPFDGSRKLCNVDENGNYELNLPASESQLIVLEDRLHASRSQWLLSESPVIWEQSNVISPKCIWHMKMEHLNKSDNRELVTENLFDLSVESDYKNFAGKITYSTTIGPANRSMKGIDFGFVNGVSRLSINGKETGVRWYGRHRYDLPDLAIDQECNISLEVFTTVGNYCKSLNNPTAIKWMSHQPYYPCGVTEFSMLLSR